MRRLWIIGMAWLAFTLTGHAQNDQKARQLLDRLAAEYQKAACTSICFEGSQQGSLLLQGKCFVLDCAGIKSWYDGQTQWSYVEQSEEVNISTPTDEELNSVHPYAWINHYATAFQCAYAGQKTIKGQTVQEVVLTPKTTSDIASITLRISDKGRPVYIGLKGTNGERQELTITSYQTMKQQPVRSFRFPEQQYPNAEIVDLR